MIKKEKGFTLAEVLITLSILGVVAAITVPSLINKQTEAANRTKVKKAMAAYEKALNQMIIDNDIKGAVSALDGSSCATTRPYFKTVEDVQGNNCQFKTADRLWWDITNIEKPIIAFEKTDLTTAKAEETTTKKAFYLLGYYDNGVLRVNDLGAAKDDNNGTPTTKNKTYLGKLYGFINNENTNEGAQMCENTVSCENDTCTITDCHGNIVANVSIIGDGDSYFISDIYDSNSKITSNCNLGEDIEFEDVINNLYNSEYFDGCMNTKDYEGKHYHGDECEYNSMKNCSECYYYNEDDDAEYVDCSMFAQ